MSKLIFDKSESGRKAHSLMPTITDAKININKKYLRNKLPLLPEVYELEIVRHYTKLSQQNFSVDGNFYPLGSCTMKYNPRCAQPLVNLPVFSMQHPYASEKNRQGFLSCIYELQEMLKKIVGMPGVSLAPMAGAQGEFAGVAMIRAYHLARNDFARDEIIVPDAAHGTNPASAAMCGYKVIEIATKNDGDVDLEILKTKVGKNTAGIMLTNPSTLGVFERNILEIADIIHTAGGLLYYDGANLNGILGKALPGKMGFDVLHLNLHKTFSTPHGGGGPGCGPVACVDKLIPFLPLPYVKNKDNFYRLVADSEQPQSIGRLSAFMGNAAIMLRAYVYLKMLGASGLQRVAEYAALNANYLMQLLIDAGFNVPYKNRRAAHEFIISFAKEAKELHISAMDIAKRLLDFGMHAPTTYFPLLVPECFLIEPTETESKQQLDYFAEILIKILREAQNNPDILHNAPHTTPVKRLDSVKAAKNPQLKEKLL